MSEQETVSVERVYAWQCPECGYDNTLLKERLCLLMNLCPKIKRFVQKSAKRASWQFRESRVVTCSRRSW